MGSFVAVQECRQVERKLKGPQGTWPWRIFWTYYITIIIIIITNIIIIIIRASPIIVVVAVVVVVVVVVVVWWWGWFLLYCVYACSKFYCQPSDEVIKYGPKLFDPAGRVLLLWYSQSIIFSDKRHWLHRRLMSFEFFVSSGATLLLCVWKQRMWHYWKTKQCGSSGKKTQSSVALLKNEAVWLYWKQSSVALLKSKAVWLFWKTKQCGSIEKQSSVALLKSKAMWLYWTQSNHDHCEHREGSYVFSCAASPHPRAASSSPHP